MPRARFQAVYRGTLPKKPGPHKRRLVYRPTKAIALEAMSMLGHTILIVGLFAMRVGLWVLGGAFLFWLGLQLASAGVLSS